MPTIWAQPLPATFAAVMPVLESLRFRDTASDIIAKQWNNGVDHADALMILLLMILDSGGPRPLAEVSEWAEQFGIKLLLGLDPAKLHDDKIGKTLDALVPVGEDGEPDLSRLVELHNRLANTAVCRHGIATDVLHYDFTEVNFSGTYMGSKLVRKGKGPARRQFELGLNVTAQGAFPILATVYPGATNHTVSVPDNLAKLTERLPEQKFCVVTDAAGLCYDNVVAYEQAGQHYVSSRQLREWEKRDIAALAPELFTLARCRSSKGDRFWLHEREWPLAPKNKDGAVTMRAVVVMSESMQRRDREKARGQMRRLLARLRDIAGHAGGRGNYRRPEYVREMLDNALAKFRHASSFVTVDVREEFGLSWTVDWSGFRDARARLGRWALFTNLPAATHSADDVLEMYRGRHVVESSYRQLKSELEIAPMHLRLANRLYALAGVYVIALMVMSVLQMLARRAGLSTKRGQALTSRELLRNMKAATAVAIEVDGQLRAVVGPLSDLAQEYLGAMGFPDAQHWLTAPSFDLAALSGT